MNLGSWCPIAKIMTMSVLCSYNQALSIQLFTFSFRWVPHDNWVPVYVSSASTPANMTNRSIRLCIEEDVIAPIRSIESMALIDMWRRNFIVLDSWRLANSFPIVPFSLRPLPWELRHASNSNSQPSEIRFGVADVGLKLEALVQTLFSTLQVGFVRF